MIRALRRRRPKVLFAEDEDDPCRGYLFPMCLKPGEPGVVIEAFGDVLRGLR